MTSPLATSHAPSDMSRGLPEAFRIGRVGGSAGRALRTPAMCVIPCGPIPAEADGSVRKTCGSSTGF